MNSILSEKEYQKFILERLEQDNGYIIRDSKKYDRYYAVDRELVFKFLNNTQPDKMQILEKIYKGDLEETVINYVNQEITKTRGSLLDVLKHGVDISNQHLELMYTKPATTFNKELLALYDMNIFSVMELRLRRLFINRMESFHLHRVEIHTLCQRKNKQNFLAKISVTKK